MADDEEETALELELEDGQAVLIVTGACLRAEVADRPLAYRLQRRIRRWLKQHGEKLNVPVEPLVCSDVWYLNSEQLQAQPTVSIGGPGVNALSAYFSQDLPEETYDERQVIIQIDPEFTDLRVCLWGSDHALTAKGLSVFMKDYLDGYLQAVATQVEPREEE